MKEKETFPNDKIKKGLERNVEVPDGPVKVGQRDMILQWNSSRPRKKKVQVDTVVSHGDSARSPLRITMRHCHLTNLAAHGSPEAPNSVPRWTERGLNFDINPSHSWGSIES